jgi:hypothetical protein
VRGRGENEKFSSVCQNQFVLRGVFRPSVELADEKTFHEQFFISLGLFFSVTCHTFCSFIHFFINEISHDEGELDEHKYLMSPDENETAVNYNLIKYSQSLNTVEDKTGNNPLLNGNCYLTQWVFEKYNGKKWKSRRKHIHGVDVLL